MEGHNAHPHHHKHPAAHHHNLDRFQKADRPIRLMTYNTFLRPLVGSTTDFKDERVAFIKDAIKDHDIVCMQEIFPNFNNRRKTLIEYAHTLGFQYLSIPPGPSFISMLGGSVVNSGLLTLSKFPIVVTEFHQFSHKAGADALATKGVLYSKIKFPNHHHLHLFNVHTQATYNREYHWSSKVDHKNFMARLKQIREFRDIIDRCLNAHSRLFKDGPEQFKDIIILAGDFNVNANGNHLPSLNFSELHWVRTKSSEKFREYEYLVGVLSKNGKDKLVDLAFEGMGKHPITFGDSCLDEAGNLIPKESLFTTKLEQLSHQCLDYIFHLTPCSDITSKPAFSVHPQDCKIKEFFIANQVFSQLSDHYAVECSFVVEEHSN